MGYARESIDLKENYRFLIVGKNVGFQRYTSKKLMSLLIHTVSIYWRDPDVD